MKYYETTMTDNTHEQERLVDHLKSKYSDDYLLAYDCHDTCKKVSLLSLRDNLKKAELVD